MYDKSQKMHIEPHAKCHILQFIYKFQIIIMHEMLDCEVFLNSFLQWFFSVLSLFISEINEYAIQIGINPKTEPHLLYLARDGLLQAIPPEWQIW